MKKDYVTPCAYFELFTPNQFALGCTPGVSEDGLNPIEQRCYNYDHPNTRQYYNNATTTSCSPGTITSKECSAVNVSQTLITTKASCNIKFDDETGVGSADLEIIPIRYATGGSGSKNNPYTWGNPTYVYRWDNQVGGTHTMPINSMPGNYIDNNGLSHYFNS